MDASDASWRSERLGPTPRQARLLVENAATLWKQTAASTTIYYLLTPSSPLGAFHCNASRTVHTLHRGRGRCIIIHVDQAACHGGKAPVESFVVGHRLEEDERLQWIVEGGKAKSSYLWPDSDAGETEGLLISETVVPGFEFADHDFLTAEMMEELLTPE
ncbi:hypothetical protein N8T08_003725 [Aspergillus melleus]|uniref:Uncharacterized protein n=1 Tax=Aspergillus melleus TaxID=138277 RepID=A0ACC3B6F0_9EURO|nr:hypothetical protein N8T08_003725 [Aspergillus melleus]